MKASSEFDLAPSDFDAEHTKRGFAKKIASCIPRGRLLGPVSVTFLDSTGHRWEGLGPFTIARDVLNDEKFDRRSEMLSRAWDLAWNSYWKAALGRLSFEGQPHEAIEPLMRRRSEQYDQIKANRVLPTRIRIEYEALECVA